MREWLNRKTHKDSRYLIISVSNMVEEYLFKESPYDKITIIEAIIDAEKELESWRKAVLNKKESANK